MKGRAMMSRFWRDCRGSGAVEFALVAPVVILMIFAGIGGGVLAYATVSLQRATEVAARCMSMDRADLCTAANIATYGTAAYGGPSLSSMTFTAAKVACGYRISGSGTFSLFPGLSFFSVNLHANACYPGIRV
ncbi:pilus assembly protein [Novosphingobium flavum]|uniref:Pilus assembly protein n=1 Tax=Novosphingobium flavum TaxID=1778672 RepID=A0A7X1FSR4_9SPHN|nr:TadE/TadG family type IV pilus assembly protein [Novosphingobium flavum]MBC2666286.1 pilus assembly protein [Novosphingobium flavum]